MAARKSMVVLCIVIAFLMSSVPVPLFAQDSVELGQAAENTGKFREAFTRYMEALRLTVEGSEEEQRLCEKIIGVVARMDVKPSVPEEAIMFEGRAEAAVKNAGSNEDYLDAAYEYTQAMRLAPWNAQVYYNLGLVYEEAGDPGEAIRYLRIYLIAAPGAADAVTIKKKIAGLEYEIEKAEEQVAEGEAQAAEDENTAYTLAGEWQEEPMPVIDANGRQTVIYRHKIRIEESGNELRAETFQVAGLRSATDWSPVYRNQTLTYFEGRLENGLITGTLYGLSPSENLEYFEVWTAYDVESSEISEDGNTITLRYRTPTGEEGEQTLLRL